MKKIQNLRDLFVEQGRELYDASRQEERALPGIEQQARNPELRQVIEQEISRAKDQRKRLESAFKKLKASIEGERNTCCESIIKHTQDLINRTTKPNIRDAVIINSIQKLDHLKITGLGSLAAYANQIGEHEIAQSFHDVLEEEWEVDRHLSRLAEREINEKAALEPLV